MGCLGLIKCFARRTVEFLIIALLLTFIPNIPPHASISKSYSVAPTKPFVGSLALNDRLNGIELWHKGEINGPEAFAEYRGELYTTLHGGDVVKLVGNHIVPVTKFGKPCKGIHEEQICGRPLGLNFNKNGDLFVADAYYGIFKVNVNTGEKQRLVAWGEVIEGKNVTLPNSVAVANNGDIYWTESSTQFTLQDGALDFLADCTGRLIHYNAKTKKNKVLINELCFANGLALTDDESFVIVAESRQSRFRRYYLDGPKKGTSDVFIDGLPGALDNVKQDGKGGFILPLVMAIDDENPSLFNALAPFPLLRRFVARVFGLTQIIFKTINDVYPNEVAARGVHFIGHFSAFSFLHPKRFTILHISKAGKIIDSIHTFEKKVQGISEVHVFKDTLYLGSPFTDYIGRIPLSKIGWEHLKPVQPTTTPKPTTTTTPKSTTTTTTTPKPTTTPKSTTTTTPKPTTAVPKATTPSPKPTTTSKPVTTAKPVQKETKPVQNEAKPAQKETKPLQKETKPVPKEAQPVQKEAKPQNIKDQPKTIPVTETRKAKKN